MSLILLFARLLLASVFLLAGLAKLGDLAGSRQAVTAFGVPERLARPMGTVLPFIELAAGMALIPSATARFGALLALALLVVFAGAIALALANGREPDCHCFGQLRSAPASWRTLLRDAGLAAVAAFVLAAGWSNTGASATGWIGALGATAAVGLLGGGVILVVLCFLAWFSLQLLRQHGRLPARIELLEKRVGLPTAAPDGDGRSAHGSQVGVEGSPPLHVGELLDFMELGVMTFQFACLVSGQNSSFLSVTGTCE